MQPVNSFAGIEFVDLVSCQTPKRLKIVFSIARRQISVAFLAKSDFTLVFTLGLLTETH